MPAAPKQVNLPLQRRNNLTIVEEEYPTTDFIIENRHIIDAYQKATVEPGKLQYSHYATFHGIPCYFNVETEGFTGRGKFNCMLIDVLIFMGRFIPGIGAPSSIVIGAELKESNLYH